jgi:hypothetical protein
MEKMVSQNSKPIEPLCMFGPGGDFVKTWPRGSVFSRKSEDKKLTKIVGSLGEIIYRLLTSAESQRHIRLAGELSGQIGKLKYASKSSSTVEIADSSSGSVGKSHRLFSGEPMLFADDWRAGVRTGHKPKHHVRPHRRTSKKRSSGVIDGQGTLFEVNLKSA